MNLGLHSLARAPLSLFPLDATPEPKFRGIQPHSEALRSGEISADVPATQEDTIPEGWVCNGNAAAGHPIE